METKPDRDPGHRRGPAIERAVRALLGQRRPSDAVVGEEYGETGNGPRRWVLDPIDGTKNFVRGVPVWATLIALMEADEVYVGVVSAPALGRRWWACPRAGRLAVGVRRRAAHGCRCPGSPTLADASFSYSSLHGWDGRQAAWTGCSSWSGVWRTRGLRRLLAVRAGRRGRGGRDRRAGGLAVGPGRAGRAGRGGRRPVHRPARAARAGRRRRRCPATGSARRGLPCPAPA